MKEACQTLGAEIEHLSFCFQRVHDQGHLEVYKVRREGRLARERKVEKPSTSLGNIPRHHDNIYSPTDVEYDGRWWESSSLRRRTNLPNFRVMYLKF